MFFSNLINIFEFNVSNNNNNNKQQYLFKKMHIYILFQAGSASGLHIIIFDEIDAICKARGSVGGNTGVHDTVVNQLLAKIDGVEQLNNILVIGMTNRRDMIDEALLRPGRLEVKHFNLILFYQIDNNKYLNLGANGNQFA